MATGGLVEPISEFNKNGRRIIGGIPWEFVERLGTMGGAELDYPIGNIPFDPELYKLAAQRMVLESGAELYLGCRMYGCTMEGRRVKTVMLASRSGNFALEAKCFVDCTGDAEVALRSGAPFQNMPGSEELQPASLCFRLSGVDTDRLENTRMMEHNKKYANQRIRSILEQWRAEGEEVPTFGGPWFTWVMRDGTVSVNMTRAQVWPENPLRASLMECALREDAFRLTALLKRLPEFKDCYISQTAVQAGYRESRRIAGRHILTGEEFVGHRVFEDTIALSAHPVDIHCVGSSQQDVAFLEQAGCIPYRSLVMEHFPNLIVGGRCISADRVAFASIRVQAPAMAIGQAAGTAAAVSCLAGTDVNQLDGRQIRNLLKNQGAFVA